MTDDALKSRLLARREIDGDGHWVWVGNWEKGTGYGCIRISKTKMERVHRTAARLWLGLQPGQIVAHQKGCPPACFFPEHLRVYANRVAMNKVVGARPDQRGFKNSRATLTPFALELIRESLEEGVESYAALAERVSEVIGRRVLKATVGMIARGESWRSELGKGPKGIESRLAAGRRRRKTG